MKRVKYLGAGLLVLILVSVSIAYRLREASKAPQESSQAASPPKGESKGTIIRRKQLRLIQVENEDRVIRQPITGRVIAKNKTQIFAEVQGRILTGHKAFKEGVTYRKGEPLLQIDYKEFALNLESQKSDFLNLITGMMPDLKADYSDSYSAWQTYVKEYQTGKPLNPLPKPLSDGEKYFVTSHQVYSTYFALKAQEERLKKFTIYAPYNCMLTDTRVDIGGLASPGQPMATIISRDGFELEAGVKVELATRLKIGDQVLFQSNELEGEWLGRVSRIIQIIDEKTQNVPVYFKLQGPSIKSGLYLEGAWATESHEAVFCIHNSSLTRNNQVRILHQNRIQNKSVLPIAYLRDSILVRGLENGDQLIINHFDMPVAGKKITD